MRRRIVINVVISAAMKYVLELTRSCTVAYNLRARSNYYVTQKRIKSIQDIYIKQETSEDLTLHFPGRLAAFTDGK